MQESLHLKKKINKNALIVKTLIVKIQILEYILYFIPSKIKTIKG